MRWGHSQDTGRFQAGQEGVCTIVLDVVSRETRYASMSCGVIEVRSSAIPASRRSSNRWDVRRALVGSGGKAALRSFKRRETAWSMGRLRCLLRKYKEGRIEGCGCAGVLCALSEVLGVSS